MLRSLGLAAAAMLSSCAAPEATLGEVETVPDLARVGAHTSFLASDSMEGRGAGYAGEKRSAEYIAQEFRNAGLAAPKGGYIRKFDFLPIGGAEPFKTLTAHNVVGILRGSSRSNEFVVLGAHYDGQGKIGQADAGRFGLKSAGDDKIWNSASDNAVSIGAMIEIARAIAGGPRPARTIIFVAFSGEENRLNGSFDYTQNPIKPLSTHVAMINLEKLVGHEETTFILASDGSSPKFADFARAASSSSGLNVASFYDGVITDTDHFPFIAAGVPALVIGTGAYEKIHHADDEIETLRLQDLPQRIAYVSAFLKELANDDSGVLFAADTAEFSGVAGGPTTDEETRICELDSPGFLVTALASGLPGASTSLNIGDVIVSVDGNPIRFSEDGANFLEDAAQLGGNSSLEIKCGVKSSTSTITMPKKAD